MATRALLLALCLVACDDETADPTTTSADSQTQSDGEPTEVAGDDTSVAPDGADDSAPSDTAPEVDATIPLGPIGGARPARIILPEDYAPGTPVPLVLELHGYSVDGNIHDTYLGFSAVAARAGFLTIIPDGTPDATGARFWNADPAWCCNFANVPVDDVAYLTGLVAEAKTLWSIDATRVYVFGHSNGGFMAHRLACAEADTFAAIASLAGSLPDAVADCDPSSPVSMLQIHGTLDGTISYDDDPNYPGAEAIADRWVSYDECTGEPTAAGPFDYDTNVAGAETTTATWSTCDGGAEVGLWTMTASGHIPIVADSTFVADVLTFFARHTKPQ